MLKRILIWQVLSEFDIFAVVGSNKALQIVNLPVLVKDDGIVNLKFRGIHGSPLVSGICIKKATHISGIHCSDITTRN